MTAYAAGLRVSELVNLKVSDIDTQRMMIRVEQGKGKKDRYTILSSRLLAELRWYWKHYRPQTWLFPNRKGGPLSIDYAQRVYNLAKQRSGIEKGKTKGQACIDEWSCDGMGDVVASRHGPTRSD